AWSCPAGIVVSFFFQAEDGIRDFHVTGVQTCALPICTPGLGLQLLGVTTGDPLLAGVGGEPDPVAREVDRAGEALAQAAERVDRSEERRVGKEWRSGGGACDAESKESNERREQRARAW